MKICKECVIEKEESEFPVLTKSDDGSPLTFRKLCKDCYSKKRSENIEYKARQNAKDREIRAKIKEKSEEFHGLRTCVICEIQKSLDSVNFSPIKTIIKEKEYINFRTECRSCYNDLRCKNEKYKEWAKKYRKLEKVKEKSNARKRTEKHKAVARARHHVRKEIDPIYVLKHNVRERTRAFLLAKDWDRELSFAQYIGCTPEFFKDHLEKQFEPWMNWENYGNEDGMWQIDHYIPLASSTTPEEMYKLCHYTNCRPLLVELNRIKKDKMPDGQE